MLRSFLTYLFQEGRTRTNLASAVPSVAGWRLSELPRYLESAQVEQLLRSCDRRCKVGKRDYATLLRWYRSSTDVEAHLPELSTYLGHTSVQQTYWYLSAVPELLQAYFTERLMQQRNASPLTIANSTHSSKHTMSLC